MKPPDLSCFLLITKEKNREREREKKKELFDYRDVEILVVTGNELAPESHDGVCFVLVSTDQVVILLGIQ